MFKLSSEASLDGAITVENKFIVEYLPYADGDYVKVYLYGLSLAARKGDRDDTVDRLARRLDLDITTVNAAIDYWSELGLMSRLGNDICYLSTRTARPKIKKYDVDKYREFNRQAQLFIAARQIAPNEYNEYYALMEKLNIEWQAMALIVNYCVKIKGDNVSAPYILAVARNLAQDGYRTAEEVGDRLDEYGVYYNDICGVLSAMGSRQHPDHEAVGLYKKWVMVFKLTPEVILHVASGIKRGGITALDAKLTVYSELSLTSCEKIDGYEAERAAMFKLAKSINKALGLYYDNVEPELSTYIKPWLALGMEPAALIALADYCMKKDMKRLSDLDAVVRDFFARGLTDEGSVLGHIESSHKHDIAIEKLLRSINIHGAVKDIHRAYYSNWKDKWDIPDELIEYAATLAADKANPLAYMNAVLLAWHSSGVTTVAGAKSAAPAPETAQPDAVGKLSADEVNGLVTHIIVEED